MPPQETLQYSHVSLAQTPVVSVIVSPGSWCAHGFVCALQDWRSCESPAIHFFWLLKSDSLGISSPFAGSPVWEAWCGTQNLHTSVRTSLVLLLFSPSRYGIWFYRDYTISLQFPFVLGCGVSFFGEFQHLPGSAYSTSSWDFGTLAGEDDYMFFYFTILNYSCWLLLN